MAILAITEGHPNVLAHVHHLDPDPPRQNACMSHFCKQVPAMRRVPRRHPKPCMSLRQEDEGERPLRTGLLLRQASHSSSKGVLGPQLLPAVDAKVETGERV